MMLRVAMIVVLTAASAAAQSKPLDPLFGLRDKAEKAAAAWQTLADGLDAKTTRMLPCDPKMKAAVEEVSRASEARMAALIEYLREATVRARQESEAARKGLAEVDALTAQIGAETTDADQFRAGLEAQMTELGEGAKRRASLVEPWRELQEILKNPTGAAQVIGGQQDALRAALNERMTAVQARQTALQAELNAATTEAARWSTYYAARLSRTQMECNITRGVTAAPAPTKKTPPRKKK
jgi:hypothetical protein